MIIRQSIESGFTLFEVIIALAISSVVALTLIGLFIQNNNVFTNQQIKTSQGVSQNSAFAKISSAIRSASAVVAGYPAVNPTYISNASTIVLQLPSVDANGNVINSTFDYIIIVKDSQNDKILRQLMYADSASSRTNTNQVLATDLSQIIFLYLDNAKNPVSPTSASIVNFTINLGTQNGLNNEQSSSSAQISLRNN